MTRACFRQIPFRELDSHLRCSCNSRHEICLRSLLDCVQILVFFPPLRGKGRKPHHAESHFFFWASFRMVRKAVFFLGKLPHFAESCFFFWASFRILRKAVFFSGQASAFCGKLFFLWADFRKMRKTISVQYTHDAFLFDSGSLYIVFA